MQSNAYVSGPETPLAAVVRLAASAATGELIAASDAVEIHVYFLEGRLAWATTSTARQTFLHHLVEHHQVSADVVRDVIEECQRSRKRLGETLIGWGVASAEQVRDALAAQIVEALDAVRAHPGARTLFLPRRMAYSRELTFALDDLLSRRPATDLAGAAESLIATVLDAVPDTLWVEVIGPDGGVGRAVRGSARPGDELAPLREALHVHDIDSLVLRTRAGVILGQRLPGHPASIWCAAGPEAKLGVATTVLASAVGASAPVPVPATAEAWQEASTGGGPLAPGVIGGAMRTADDLVAGIALHDDGRAGTCWRGADPRDAHLAVARALAPLLTVRLRDALSTRTDALAYEEMSLRGTRGPLAYHGTRVPGRPASVWLALHAWASQGLGWALLQTVSRQVGDAPGGEW